MVEGHRSAEGVPIGSEGRDGSQEAEIRVEHDFGVVPPGETREHVFVLENPTSDVWTFERIEVESGCSCTVAELSTEVILPHDQAHIKVQFRMPSRASDVAYHVAVTFKESPAPRVVLTGRALVRRAITCSPTELRINGLGQGQVAERHFEIDNYSDSSWGELSVQPTEAWITATPVILRTEPHEGGSRQAWRVVLHCDTSGLLPGRYDVPIAIEVPGSNLESQVVRVHVEVLPPVRVIPEQLFFGVLSVGESAAATVGLHFAPDYTPGDTDSVTLETDLPSGLSLVWTRSEGRFWLLNAKLVAENSGHFVKGAVTIRFEDEQIPAIQIPVTAMVE